MKFAFFNKNNEEEQKAITDCCVLEFFNRINTSPFYDTNLSATAMIKLFLNQ